MQIVRTRRLFKNTHGP